MEKNNEEFIEGAFEEIRSLGPYIKEIRILNKPPNFEEEYYRIESDGKDSRLCSRYTIARIFWNLKYKSRTRGGWLLISYWSSLSGLILIIALHSIFVRFILKLHYETEGLERLVVIVGKKDHYTAEYSRNVAKIADLIGKKMNLKRKELRILEIIGKLHDIGKIAVPDYVWNKPGKLTDEEFEIIKKHPVVGADILKEFPELSWSRSPSSISTRE